MDIFNILVYAAIFYSATMAFITGQALKRAHANIRETEDRIRKITDDIRHISMVVERTSTSIAGLNVHKNDLMDVQKDVAKLQVEVKSLEVPMPIHSPLPTLKKKEEKPYVKVKY